MLLLDVEQPTSNIAKRSSAKGLIVLRESMAARWTPEFNFTESSERNRAKAAGGGVRPHELFFSSCFQWRTSQVNQRPIKDATMTRSGTMQE